MDNQNKAIPKPNAFDVNSAMMRCLVKAIAAHGLGLYIYAGEDLPEDEKEQIKNQQVQAQQQAQQHVVEHPVSKHPVELTPLTNRLYVMLNPIIAALIIILLLELIIFII